LTKVTVGIPSYNEKSNIKTILESLVYSNLNSINLSEIIISDDSTDDTPNIVNQFMKNHSKKIIFLHNDKRKGAASAWNDIIQNANGEIIVLYDADVNPNPDCTVELVKKINDNVGICASNPKAIPSKGIPAQGTIFLGSWLESVRKRQLSQYTVMGRGLSIRSDIAKKITIPETLIAIDLYLQNRVIDMGYDVVFNPNAVVQFKPAKTFVDFSSQVMRATKGHRQLKELGYSIKYQLSFRAAIGEFIRVAMKNPNGALSACLCLIMIPVFASRGKNLDNELWHIAESTK